MLLVKLVLPQQQDLQMDFQLTASASICDERSTSFHRIFNYAPVTFFHFDLLRSVPKAKKLTFRRPKNYSFLKLRKRNLSFPERCKPFCPAKKNPIYSLFSFLSHLICMPPVDLTRSQCQSFLRSNALELVTK